VLRIDHAQKLSHSWWRCRFMHWPMTRPVATSRAAKQCRRPIAFVIVGHGPGPTFLHRQPGLGAVKRLDLALFVDREHDGFVRRIEIKPTTS